MLAVAKKKLELVCEMFLTIPIKIKVCEASVPFIKTPAITIMILEITLPELRKMI